MDNLYVIIPRNCTGCRTCELACAMVKGRNGALGQSRIRIFPIGEASYVQMNCLQCAEAACAKVCPTQALVRNEVTRAVELDAGRCIGCALCEAACPFGHIQFDRASGKPLKCDLCGGAPACAKFCPHRALEMR
ncbi:MAG: 4Fe-4S dicluster domain-containing protein [Proteobacteria bacterium]|jgi:Fe-S-cluster-containing hydrogenase component 2|nr:4Fe-4S dicluster domain-containing protein [Pseudomonadota bacterium]